VVQDEPSTTSPGESLTLAANDVPALVWAFSADVDVSGEDAAFSGTTGFRVRSRAGIWNDGFVIFAGAEDEVLAGPATVTPTWGVNDQAEFISATVAFSAKP
jgi:hypothetical protein